MIARMAPYRLQKKERPLLLSIFCDFKGSWSRGIYLITSYQSNEGKWHSTLLHRHRSNIWKIFQLGDKIKKFVWIKSRSVCSKEIRVKAIKLIFFYVQTSNLVTASFFRIRLVDLASIQNHDRGSRFFTHLKSNYFIYRIHSVITLGGIFNVYYLLDINYFILFFVSHLPAARV